MADEFIQLIDLNLFQQVRVDERIVDLFERMKEAGSPKLLLARMRMDKERNKCLRAKQMQAQIELFENNDSVGPRFQDSSLT